MMLGSAIIEQELLEVDELDNLDGASDETNHAHISKNEDSQDSTKRLAAEGQQNINMTVRSELLIRSEVHLD